MIRRVRVACGAALFAAACAPPTPGGLADCPERYDALSQWEDAGLSAAVVVLREGVVECAVGLGTSDGSLVIEPDRHVFGIGSITKTVVAAAVLDLVTDGVLDLDDRVAEHVPQVVGPVAGATVLDLLVHRSGLGSGHGSDGKPLTREEALSRIAGQDPAFEPGAGFGYSNSGYTVLAAILEEVTDQPFRDIVVDRVLTVDGERLGGWWDGAPAPDGPRAIGTRADGTRGSTSGDFAGPHWALEGNGGLAMTADELARWVEALASGEIIDLDALGTMMAAVVDHGDGTGEAPGWVTLDAEIIGRPAFVSSGGGDRIAHETTVAWIPDDGLVIVVAANTATVAPAEFVRRAAPAIVGGTDLPGPVEFVDVPRSDLEPLAGTYALDGLDGRLVVRATDAGLAVEASAPGAVGVLFNPVSPSIADAMDGHERLAIDFFEGRSAAGAEEIALLSEEYGALEGWRLIGTTFEHGESRTYAELQFASATITEWIALDSTGGLSGADAGNVAPTLHLGPISATAFAPVLTAGTPPDIRLDAIEPDVLKLSTTGGAELATARRVTDS